MKTLLIFDVPLRCCTGKGGSARTQRLCMNGREWQCGLPVSVRAHAGGRAVCWPDDPAGGCVYDPNGTMTVRMCQERAAQSKLRQAAMHRPRATHSTMTPTGQSFGLAEALLSGRLARACRKRGFVAGYKAAAFSLVRQGSPSLRTLLVGGHPSPPAWGRRPAPWR